jgi:hypothetical protein
METALILLTITISLLPCIREKNFPTNQDALFQTPFFPTLSITLYPNNFKIKGAFKVIAKNLRMETLLLSSRFRISFTLVLKATQKSISTREEIISLSALIYSNFAFIQLILNLNIRIQIVQKKDFFITRNVSVTLGILLIIIAHLAEK